MFTAESMTVMIYKNSYNVHRIVWPLGQFFVCASLTPLFMIYG